MTGGIRFIYAARTMAEATDIALERWRQWVDDPVAELPWSTHFDVTEEIGSDDGSKLEVTCRIEFDRQQLEKGVVKDS